MFILRCILTLYSCSFIFYSIQRARYLSLGDIACVHEIFAGKRGNSNYIFASKFFFSSLEGAGRLVFNLSFLLYCVSTLRVIIVVNGFVHKVVQARYWWTGIYDQ